MSLESGSQPSANDSNPRREVTGDVTSESYYSSNFKEILRECLSPSNPDHHVISSDAVSVVERFRCLSESSQQLYVRLFLRKHHWLRATKVSYPDISPNLNPILENLCDMEFLSNESMLTDPSVILNLLQVSELKNICKQFHLGPGVLTSTKPKIINSLFKHDREHQPLFGKSQFMTSVVKKARVTLGGCVKISDEYAEVFSKLMLLFSITNAWMTSRGDEDADFSQIIYHMLQVSIGRLVYPQYEVITTEPLFKDGEAFETYYQAIKDEQIFLQCVEHSEHNMANKILQNERKYLEEALNPEKLDPSSPPFLLPFTCGHVHTRIISRGVEYLEKNGKYPEANKTLQFLLSQDRYNRARRGKWWERLVLNYDYHTKDKVKCLDAIKNGLSDTSLTPASRLSLIQRAHKILQSKGSRKRKSSKRDAMVMSDIQFLGAYSLKDFPEDDNRITEVSIEGKQFHTDFKPFFLTKPKQGYSSSSQTQSLLGVENYAIDYYMKEKGWPCALHAENSTFSTIFALIMWDVIFAPIPDVFRTSFQSAPLDLFTEYFYINRKERIDAKLQWLRSTTDEEIVGVIEKCWVDNSECLCVGADWSIFPSGVKDIKEIALCFGQKLLSDICKLYAMKYRSSCSGLPDLVLWSPTEKTFKFVEVKGPGDKLSTKQLIWFSRLSEWNCSVEVCRVKENQNLSEDVIVTHFQQLQFKL